jgi:glycine/D-amino acid oxidase-like deaminating enzyme
MDSGWSERSLVVHESGRVEVPDGVVQALLAEASKVLAEHPALEVQRLGIGAKPIPGDGEPVFGYLPGAPNCYVAFTHSGATLGLIAGELIAREIVEGQRPDLLNGFGPDRFRA